MREPSPLQLQAMPRRADLTVLHVRAREKLEIACLPGALPIPMQALPRRLGGLNRRSCSVVLCHPGIRSERVARLLERSGFTDVCHLAGALDRWTEQLDPSMPRH